jgi:hypothetical protein
MIYFRYNPVSIPGSGCLGGLVPCAEDGSTGGGIMAKILIVDDEEKLRGLIKRYAILKGMK